MRIKFEKIALFYIIAMCYSINFLPIVRGFFPIAGIGAIKELLSFGVCIVFMFKNLRFMSSNTFVIFSFLITFTALGLLRDLDVVNVFDSLRYTWMYVITMYFIYKHYRNRGERFFSKYRNTIFKNLCISYGLVVLVALLEATVAREFIKSLYGDYFLNDFYGGVLGARLTSTIGNPIMLGYSIIIFMFLTIICNWSPYKNLWFHVAIFPLLVLTFSRIAIFLGCAHLTFYFILNLLKKPFRYVLFILILFIVLRRYIDGGTDIYSLIVSRLSESSLSMIMEDPRIVRWVEITGTLPMLFMLSGAGIGIFGWNVGQLFSENLYLAIFIEYGVLGLITFILLLVQYYILTYRKKLSMDEKIYYNGSLCVFIIGGVVSDLHMTLPFSFLIWLNFFLLIDIKGTRN